ncbi:uncharacterized protein [Coffea arabica]|uniref:Uncharacterized protein n=1 Tax=Coffea arabica TaxID=13443 RepID=A0ABM4UTD3_COFAR|nr:uncharacterized protein LOC113695340 [Coffea arabica]
MAYRRRQGIARSPTFQEDIISSPAPPPPAPGTAATGGGGGGYHATASSSLAAQAIRASAAHRDSSLSSAYAANSAFPSSFNNPSKGSPTYDYTSMKSSNEPGGFWGVLARKAKAILDDDDISHPSFPATTRTNPKEFLPSSTHSQPYQTAESYRKADNPTFRKGLDALTTSLNHIGDTIGSAFEEGRTIVESKTADIIQETRKLQIRRKGTNFDEGNQVPDVHNAVQQSAQPHMQTSQEDQLKASRDVAMATAAKAKLLLRELKTVKADLAFAKQRCSQLEEENKLLREARDKGDNPADDDMIRLQLETLLAEKARLAHENSVYARENRFLREIVEYHQLTMQDVVYLDEGIEEVTEVYPIPAVSRMLSASPPSPTSPSSPTGSSPSRSIQVTQQILEIPLLPKATTGVSRHDTPTICTGPISTTEGPIRHRGA